MRPRTAALRAACALCVRALSPLCAQDFDDGGFADFGEDARGITVTGTPRTTQKIEVIEKAEIEKRNAGDLATLLEETLDIGITRYGAYGNQVEINLRGFDSSRVAILIDGVPANSARSGQFDVSQIDLSNVERVEVIYGGSDMTYNVSGALGGVINIITAGAQKAGWRLGGGLANTGYMPGRHNKRGAVEAARYEDLADTQALNLFAGYGGARSSYKLNLFGTRAGNHYLYKDYAGFARRKQGNEVWDAGFNGSGIWNLPRAAALHAGANLYLARKQYPVTGVSEGFAEARSASLKANARYTAPAMAGGAFSTEAALSYAFNAARYGETSRGADHGISAVNRWGWYPAERLTVRAGADWRFISVDATGDSGRFGNLGGVYAGAEWKALKKLMLAASVKEATDAKQAVAVPKLGWAADITDGLKLKNNYFRSFKFPDFDDLFYRSADGLYAGNPSLEPEDGWGADFAAEWAPDGRFELSGTVYVQWTEDSIHWVKRGARWRPENVGTGCFIGFEARPAFTFAFARGPFQTLRLGASYRYQISRLLTDGLSFADNLRIPYMPAHIIGGSADLKWKSGNVLASAHYESLRYADTGNSLPLEPYCLVTLTVNQNAGAHRTAFGTLRNALNRLYTSFAEYPMPGISLTLGIRWEY